MFPLLAALSVVATTVIALLAPKLLLAVVLLTILLVALRRSWSAALSALVIYLTPLTFLQTAVPFDVRPLALLIALGHAAGTPAARRAAVAPVWSLFGVAVLSLLWTQSPGQTSEAAVGLFIAAVCVSVFAPRLTWDDLERVVLALVLLVVALTAARLVLEPSSVFAQGRFRGCFGNANTLAAFTLLSAGVLAAGRTTRGQAVVGLAGLAVVVLTASRASFLAFVVGYGYLLLRSLRRSPAHLPPIILLVLGAAYRVTSTLEQRTAGATGTGVLRTDDSRTVHWQHALQAIEERAFLGVGYDGLTFDVANSYLKIAAELGLVTTLCAVPLLVLVTRSWRRSAQARALLLMGAVNAVAESWLFAGGSVFFLLFWLSVCVAASEPRPGLSSQGDRSASEQADRVGRRHASVRTAGVHQRRRKASSGARARS